MTRLRWLLLFFLPLALSAGEWRFRTDRDGEVGLTIRAHAPGSNWSRPGAEAVVLTLAVDGRYSQDVTLFMGETPHEYGVLLGRLAAGEHRLRYERNKRYSARGAPDFKAGFQAEVLDDPALAHAPILYLRPDTAGRFSDLPILAWYEWLEEPAGRVLQFSIIFTNEDGGTATDALLARWGRTLDIEYVYRVKPDGQTYQARDHKELPFRGKKVGQHPLIYDAARNNIFSDSGNSPLRVALWPVPADLSHRSREHLADENPWTYRVMAEELAREGKIERFGDPRRFLYVEANVAAAGAAAGFAVGPYSSDRGRAGLRIERDGWVRTAIEMPRAGSVPGIEFRCHPPAKPNAAARCSIRSISKAFFLDDEYRPGPNLFSWEGPPVEVAPGTGHTFTSITAAPPPKAPR